MKFSPKKVVGFLIAVLVFLVVIGLLGGGIYEMALESVKKPVSQNTLPDEQGEEEGENGEDILSVQEESKLPEAFPEDFPTYPEAELEGSWTTQSEETLGLSVIWKTGDDLADVVSFYEEKLQESGWEATSSFNSEDSATFTFKKEQTEGFIGIASEDDKTTISATIGIKQ